MNPTLKGLALAALVMLLAVPAAADDGDELFRRNVSKTPDDETHHATIVRLPADVLAYSTDGLFIPLEYPTDDSSFTDRLYARPLVAIYEDGPVEHPPDAGGFYGHGERDLFAAVSFDDGATWKKTNLSRSADRSSIRIDRKPYPGDVFRSYAASYYDKVLAVWASRYCESGGPNYSLEPDDDVFTAIFEDSEAVDVSHLGNLEDCTDDDADDGTPEDTTQCLYFEDYWGVAGSQGIADFADEGYPTVGEVPYACLWAARGTLEQARDDSGAVIPDKYEVVWRQAERLTSGRRDVHRMEAACAPLAGCVITWQEDPDGLRPGEGEGPGEGWSGAIGHHETDIWYSFIDWDNFGLVATSDDDPTPIHYSEYEGATGAKVGVPFSMPVRLSDNAMCMTAITNSSGQTETVEDDPYCFMDFNTEIEGPDLCVETVDYFVDVPEDGTSSDHTIAMCVAEDGRLMRGNTAATRARVGLHTYDSDNDGVGDSAWVVMAYEENKGLGDEDDIDQQDPTEDPIDKVDMGKNIWYHTFDMFQPELVSQGLMLNQPAVYPAGFVLEDLTWPSLVVDTANYPYDDGNYFVTVEPDPIYDNVSLDDDDHVLYQTEIARRFSLISQDIADVMASDNGVAAFATFKQGVIRRGGPADIMARRFILPDTFDESVDNPYDYANMECDDWLFNDGSNPRYVKGLCLSSAINVSGTTATLCNDAVATGGCGYEDGWVDGVFPFDPHFADIGGDDGAQVALVYEWRQCDPAATFDGCPYDDDVDSQDQSWENPFDMAKGHRGFIKGDFLTVYYVWTPNWSANSVGQENANLYVRRSFDGGLTWTTLPADFTMTLPDDVIVIADGTSHCEWYMEGGGDRTETATCFDYAAGDFEQARNVSMLFGTHLTVLDPRYTPTPPSTLVCYDEAANDGAGGWVNCGYIDDYPYPDDVTDPSKFFTTFETGDTSGLADGGEAIPQDLFYARAVDFGDEYELAVDEGTDPILLETGDTTDTEFSQFDWLEQDHDDHASEAAVVTNPGGTLFYAIWNQWQEDDDENVLNSDAWFRRTMELGEDYITFPSGGDGGAPTEPPGPGGGGGKPGKP